MEGRIFGIPAPPAQAAAPFARSGSTSPAPSAAAPPVVRGSGSRSPAPSAAAEASPDAPASDGGGGKSPRTPGAAALVLAASRLAEAVAAAIADARGASVFHQQCEGLTEEVVEEGFFFLDEVDNEVDDQRVGWSRETDGVETHVGSHLNL